MRAGEALELKPWERANLLEYVCAAPGDELSVAAQLLTTALPSWRLDDAIAAAVPARNEQIALALLGQGATPPLLGDAAQAGLASLCQALVDRGARINRRFTAEHAPLHRAARSPAPEPTLRVLVSAACDLTVTTPAGQHVWDLADTDLASWLENSVGQHGPQWFRDAQIGGIDHYVFVREGAMFGFNPNDVQTPIWTGDDVEGFGWPNTAEQALALLDDNRVLRGELDWFVPFLEKIAQREDFSLAQLEGEMSPAMRPTPRR